MKFKKAVLIEIEDSAFDSSYWQQLDSLVEKRVSKQRSAVKSPVNS